MKIVIRNSDSGEYFAGDDGWVREHERALIFPSGVEAFGHIRGQKLPALHIVFKFDDPKFDFEIQGPSVR